MMSTAPQSLQDEHTRVLAEQEDLTERLRLAEAERAQRREDAEERKRSEQEEKALREEKENKEEDEELTQLLSLAERNSAIFKQQYDKQEAVSVYFRREQDVIMTDELDGKGRVQKKV